MKNALLVVAKEPVAGQVKTRLGNTFDSETTAAFYRCLIEDTLELTRRVPNVDRGVVYTPESAGEAFAQMVGRADFVLTPQHGPDLGTRLANAFRDFIERGHERVVIVDSDSPTLPVQYLETAFALLDEHDVVFGPCEDGGYYLVGARAVHPGLFAGVRMSTPTVLEETLERARELGLRTGLLPVWYDVDLPADVERLRLELQAAPERAVHTARFFAGLTERS